MATLLLVYETEIACRTRLEASGITPAHALEISSYLAQSTDIAHEFGDIERECRLAGLGFRPVDLDDLPAELGRSDRDTTLIWTLTDGIAYFRGGVSPALARLGGFATIGADDSLFALCQDKFRSGAVVRALGLPAPGAGLARDGTFLVEPPSSDTGWFVKPNRLGAKIGIWEDSRCATLGEALAISRRIYEAYRDDAIVQPYLLGRNVRASYLAVDPKTGLGALSSVFVDAGGDFQTMQDSLALYGETGAAAKTDGRYTEPALVDVADSQPEAAKAIATIADGLMRRLGLRDVFSIDLRLEEDGTAHLVEFEVCPGLPCFDFRDYCNRRWSMSLAEAIARTARARLPG